MVGHMRQFSAALGGARRRWQRRMARPRRRCLDAAMLTLTALPALAGVANGQTPDIAPAPVFGDATLPRDLSPWGMFTSADIVVKAVIIGLAFASVVTWTTSAPMARLRSPGEPVTTVRPSSMIVNVVGISVSYDEKSRDASACPRPALCSFVRTIPALTTRTRATRVGRRRPCCGAWPRRSPGRPRCLPPRCRRSSS